MMLPSAWLLAGRTARWRWVATARDRCGRRRPATAVTPPAWSAPRRGSRRRSTGIYKDHVRGVWHACRRGLDALDEHRASMGSTELRALASVQGDELARLALTPRGRARARGTSCGGASAGGPRRWPCRRFEPPQDRELDRSAGGDARQRPAGSPEARDDDEPTALSGSGAGSPGEGDPAPAPAGGRGADGDRPGSRWGSTWTDWSTRSATRRSSSCSRSPVDCGRIVVDRWPGPGLRRGKCCGRRGGGGLRAVRAAPGRAWPAGAARRVSAPAFRARCSVRGWRRTARGSVVVSPTAALHATPWGGLPGSGGRGR